MTEKYTIFLHVSAILVLCLPYLKSLLVNSFLIEHLGARVVSILFSLLFYLLLSIQFYCSYMLFKNFLADHGLFIVSFYKNLWNKIISFFKWW